MQRMRGDIELKLEGKESSFRVSYGSPDPKTAQKVTERLAALYIEENLRDRESSPTAPAVSGVPAARTRSGG